MNEDTARLPAMDTDPSLAPDEGEEGRVVGAVEQDDAGAPIIVIDRADRLAVEHGDAPVGGDEDEARALD